MTKGAWFHCFSGIAGDMALGSLVDAGADIGEIRSLLNNLDLDDWNIESEITQRAGIRATHLRVLHEENGSAVRTFSNIRDLIRNAELPARIESRALAVFTRLAEVEGRLHNHEPEQVHFHEVGGVDAIIDIVGTCAALELLGVDSIHCSPVAMGTGTVVAAHGTLPNPAPAVISLLEGAPVYGVDRSVELTTPTGAAIVSALAEGFGPMPAFDPLLSSGFGAGSSDFDGLPNCTQVVIGTLERVRLTSAGHQNAMLLEVNVDDITGELIAHTMSRLMDSGAQDAWVTPILMKKGRPAHTISVLSDPVDASGLAEILMAETGTFGIRGHAVEKWPSQRKFGSVSVEGSSIGTKTGRHRSKVEFDDAALIARETERPLRGVIAEAEVSSRSETKNPSSE